jgi:hypothetical protein
MRQASNLQMDMKQPIGSESHDRYGMFMDIGCLQHVFAPRQCIENCLRLVAPGGHYLLCTPVSGYVGHGFHAFDPRGLVAAPTLNGFEVVYLRCSTREGRILERPRDDTLLWMVGRKIAPIRDFKIPQQNWWEEGFGSGASSPLPESPSRGSP